jgi:hypothetical protein
MLELDNDERENDSVLRKKNKIEKNAFTKKK